jgi:hypothetical protein
MVRATASFEFDTSSGDVGRAITNEKKRFAPCFRRRAIADIGTINKQRPGVQQR